MSLAKKILPRVLGSIVGASFGLYLMTTSVITDPGYESALMMQPPFLSAVFTGDVDQPGRHYHLQFTTGIPVKKVQEFTEVGVQLISSDYKSVKADITLTLKVNEPARLLRDNGEGWYKQQVAMAVRGTAGLTGMGFSEEDLLGGDAVDTGRFNILAMLKLQEVMSNKDIPVIVQNFKVVRVYR